MTVRKTFVDGLPNPFRRKTCVVARLLVQLCTVLLLLVLSVEDAKLASAQLSIYDAVPYTPTKMVASLASTSPPGEVTQQQLPIFGTVLNTSLGGAYCIDKENNVLYVGSNILHVFEIRAYKSTETGTGTRNTSNEFPDLSSATNPSHYFVQTGTIDVEGWATACIFMNRYELYVAVTQTNATATDSTSQASSNARQAAATIVTNGTAKIWGGSILGTVGRVSTESQSYVVIHRHLRDKIRVVSGVEQAARQYAIPPSDLPAGASVPLRSLTTGETTSLVVTPRWEGYITVRDLHERVSIARSIAFDEAEVPQMVVQPVAGQSRGATNFYVLTFALANASSSSSSSSVPTAEKYTWDIVGMRLPDMNFITGDPYPVEGLVTERLRRCYAPIFDEVVPDAFPISIAASAKGIVVLMKSEVFFVTLATVLPTNTACTRVSPTINISEELLKRKEEKEDTAPLFSSSAAVAATSLRSRSMTYGRREVHRTEAAEEELAWADTINSSSSSSESSTESTERPAINFVVVADDVCTVPAIVVDDYGDEQLYIALQCGERDAFYYNTVSRFLVRLQIPFSEDADLASVTTTPILDPNRLVEADDDDTTEQILSLTLVNETRLLHLAVRRADGLVRVYTYAAFGLTALSPRATDSQGGMTLQVRGYGVTSGARCLFPSSDNALVKGNYVNSTALTCTTPPLSGAMCSVYLIAVWTPQPLPWAIPSATPHNGVVSPVSMPLTYIVTPDVRAVVNKDTLESRALEGSNVTLLILGRNLINPAEYGTQFICSISPSVSFVVASATAPATYLNSSALECQFDEIKRVGNVMLVSISLDGSDVMSSTSSFTVYAEASGLVAYTLTSTYEDVGNGGVVITTILNILVALEVNSEASTPLPEFVAQLVDSYGNAVVPPDPSTQLYAVFSYKPSLQSDNITVATSSSAQLITSDMYPGEWNGFFFFRVPIDSEGQATFSDVLLECPGTGGHMFEVLVANETAVLQHYAGVEISVHVKAGDPHSATFVAPPSTWYYPDVPLLQQQPVVGVQDACGNVYSYLNDSVLVGPLTVQLYMETLSRDVLGTGENLTIVVPFNSPWTVDKPLNSLFFINNISIPAHGFDTRFYINITCALPQPTLVSQPIAVVACNRNRQSVPVATGSSGSGDGGQAGLQGSAPTMMCQPCPTYGICNGTDAVRAEDGYWRLNATTTAFTSCRVAYGMAEACVSDGQCAPGYRGVLCGECADGYHTLGRACRKCLSRGVQGFLAALVVLAMVLLMTAFVVLMTLLPPSTLAVLSMRSLLLSVQVASLFIYIGVPWPRQLETFFNGLHAMAHVVETMVSCHLSSQGYLIFIAATPLVLIPLVTLFSVICLHFINLHRVDPHRLCAVVLMALLHRKQERFHQLRHTVAHEMGEQGEGLGSDPFSTAAGRGGNTRGATTAGTANTAAVTAPTATAAGPDSNSIISASGTRMSVSAEWAAQERNAAQSFRHQSHRHRHTDGGSMSWRRTTRTARPSFHNGVAPNASVSAVVSDSTAGQTMTGTTASESAAAASDAEVGRGMETALVDAFAAHTAAVMQRRTAAAPEKTWEELVVQAMRDGDVELLASVREMRLPLLTRQQVHAWAEHTTKIVVENGKPRHTSNINETNRNHYKIHSADYLGKADAAAAHTTEGLTNSSSKSGAAAGGANAEVRHTAPQPATPKASAQTLSRGDTDKTKYATYDTSVTATAVKATPILWKRVGMIAAYREMAVHQYRASWAALLCSSAAVVMVCYYLPLILNAFLWFQCVTVKVLPNSLEEAISVPKIGVTLSCASAAYHSLRKLAIAMLVVYGFAFPIGEMVLSYLVQRRYGEDVMYATLPVIFFGDSTFEYLLCISYMLTKLIAVIAVTMTDAPMMQMGVLASLFAITIFFNSMWGASGQSVVFQTRYLVVTLRSVMTASRVLFLLVCQILELLIYLIVSGSHLALADQRGFVGIIGIGIGLVFAMFTVVLVHQLFTHLREARYHLRTTAAREREAQVLLEALVRRYLDITRTIELYLRVWERGLAAAQKLDALSRYTHLVDEDDDGVSMADDNLLSFSSLDDAGSESSTDPDAVSTAVHDSDDGEESDNREARRHRKTLEGHRQSDPTRSATTTAARDGAAAENAGPEALTHFSPYPALSPQDFPMPSPPTTTTTTPATATATADTETAPEAAATANPAVEKRHVMSRRRTAAYLSAAFRASGGPADRSTALSSAAATDQQQLAAQPSQHTELYEPGFVSPVEGNTNWVSAPRSSAVAAMASVTDGVGCPAPQLSVDGAAIGDAGLLTVGAAATGAVAINGAPAAATATCGVPGNTAGVKVTSRGQTPTLPENSFLGKSSPLAPAQPAGDAGRVVDMDRAHTSTAASSPKAVHDVFSGDFTEVQMPTCQPTLKRSDSLLLSIRCCEPDYATAGQKTRDTLVRDSNAVATAEYEQERRELLAKQGGGPLDATSHTSKENGSPPNGSRSNHFHNEITEPTSTALLSRAKETSGAARASGAGPEFDANLTAAGASPQPAVTIESVAPLEELDFVTSFDPLAVPPLPLTRALTQRRPVTQSGSALTRNATESLLAGLKSDLEAQLQQFSAMPLRDTLLDMDLGQLLTSPSPLLGTHPISFWGGAAAAEVLTDSATGQSRANPSMVAGKSGTTHTPGTALLASKSFPNGNTSGTTSTTPAGAVSESKAASDHPASAELVGGVNTPVRPKTSQGGGIVGEVEQSEDGSGKATAGGAKGAGGSGSVPASAATVAVTTAAPPLPTFRVPHMFTRSSHRTAAEHLRRRAARTNRAHRSRSGGQNVPRNRPKGATNATAAAATPVKNAGSPRSARDLKSVNPAEAKPKTE